MTAVALGHTRRIARRDALAAAALASVLLAASAPAAPAETYRGRTDQGRAVSIQTAVDGTPERVRISWRAPCRKGRFVSRSVFVAPFERAERGRFAATSTLRIEVRGGYRARVRAAAGGRQAKDGTWRGRVRVQVAVWRDGRRVDTCRLRRTEWTARPAD